MVTDPVALGGGNEFVLPAGGIRPTLSGVVLDDLGAPVARASVSVEGPGLGVGERRDGAFGARTTTDGSGRFVLERVPATGVRLTVDHGSICRRSVPVEEWADGAALRFARSATIQVELVDRGEADALSFEGPDEVPSMAWRFEGLGRREVRQVELVDARTPVLEIPCDVATIVLLRDGRVVRRAPVQIRPGALLSLSL